MNAAAVPAGGRFQLPPFTIHQRLNAAPSGGEQVPWSLSSYRVPAAWQQSKGAGVRVLVVDTGVDDVHAAEGDLAGAIWQRRDFSGSRRGSSDREGHGTHTAGTIAARLNGFGVPGVAPECQLAIAKALGDDGTGSTEAVIDALAWGVELGCDLANLSLGSGADDPRLQRAIERAAAAGMLVVCAAGNSGGQVEYPAKYPGAIAVSAVDELRRIAPFSCRGPEIQIGAPGVKILSTFKGGGYAVLSGTSMAAPFICGALALWLSDRRTRTTARPTLAEALEHLRHGARDVGQPGRDPLTGWGLPGAELFRDDAPEIPAPPPPADVPAGRTISIRCPVGSTIDVKGEAPDPATDFEIKCEVPARVIVRGGEITGGA